MVHAQLEVRTEAQMTASDGEYTPLWLNANRYGLSSLELANGYFRAGVFRSLEQDSLTKWKRGFGADAVMAGGFASSTFFHQVYGEIGWHHGLLTIGSKEQPMELKDQELSSGSQTLGINARPVPGIRLSLPDYWTIPGVKWLGLKGHIFYGWTTDDRWQKEFTQTNSRYTENTMLHTKAGYLRFGNPKKPLTVELALEMGCQFGGKSISPNGTEKRVIYNESGLSGIIHAFIPGGGEMSDVDYHNAMGNHVGSWLARVNLDYDKWGMSLYADHFFEDQSQMFHLDYDGFGTGGEWDKWKHFNWMVYDLKDIQLGAELNLKRCQWLQTFVLEYLYTKYQSGAVYHDHTQTMPDHVGGLDGFYSHSIFTGWHHWGQVMGNPLYRSPIYNEDGRNEVKNNRFYAWHIGAKGILSPLLRYRLLATWQKGYGTYWTPYINPKVNVSLLAEAEYDLSNVPAMDGWMVKGALGVDRGSILGKNIGLQLTIAKKFNINTIKR